MILSSDTFEGYLWKSKIHQSHRASSEQVFKPVPVFYREVDLTDFPQDIPRTLRLGGFLNHPVPRDSMPKSSSSLNFE